MEDISRELERELAQAKPSPYKKHRTSRIMIIDDFGGVKSGEYLRFIAWFFFITSLILGLSTAGLYLHFSRQGKARGTLEQAVADLEKKNQKLTREKDLYMAKLVLSGKKDEILAVVSQTKEKEQEPPPPKTDPAPVQGEEDIEAKADSPSGGPVLSDKEPEAQTDEAKTQTADENLQEPESIIAVDKFTLHRSSEKSDLVVRFNIKNVKEGPGDVSGRIFLVLIPEREGPESSWLVTPKAPLKNGIPFPYTRGQSFSISRFKPVQFTIADPGQRRKFTQACVYIFGEDGQLIFKMIRQLEQNGGSDTWG